MFWIEVLYGIMSYEFVCKQRHPAVFLCNIGGLGKLSCPGAGGGMDALPEIIPWITAAFFPGIVCGMDGLFFVFCQAG